MSVDPGSERSLAARRRALSASLAARRRALSASLAARRRALREQIASTPAARRERAKRRRRRALWLLLLLLLLLGFFQCECTPSSLGGADAGVDAAVSLEPRESDAGKPASRPKAAAPLEGQTRGSRRGRFDPAAGAEPSWLDAFRLQVIARGPRLATCFDGAERPGAIRWAASVNPRGGRVFDHTLEPTGGSENLTQAQRDCAVRTLSNPAYRVDSSADEALPVRVGMVIEF